MPDNSIKETLKYLCYLIGAVFNHSVLKAIFALLFIVFSFLFDINQSEELLALFVLIQIDFISGIAAAKFNGDAIRSSKIRHTAIKITAYYSVIAGAHLAEYGLNHFLAILDETVMAFFLLTELISLLENVGRLGVETPKKLLNQLIDKKNKL
jgi:toxin secretion/phage lysis holin